MSFLSDLTARLPFLKHEEKPELFFSLHVASGKLDVALWNIEGNKLKVLQTASAPYSSDEEILTITDTLLDKVLGTSINEPEKILFGVPDSWLQDDELKEPYLKILRGLVKELELSPMAYVSSSHALAHFLEKQEGAPPTTILVGIESKYVTTSVVKAGKVVGNKVAQREDNLGLDIEKSLMQFTDIEVLPSKFQLYGDDPQILEKQKADLLSFPWMQKLPFLHFPKVVPLDLNTEINAICLAGAIEINPDVRFETTPIAAKLDALTIHDELLTTPDKPAERELPKTPQMEVTETDEDFGFVSGDVTEKQPERQEEVKAEGLDDGPVMEDSILNSESNLVEPETEEEWEEETFAPPMRQNVSVTTQEEGIQERKFPARLAFLGILLGLIPRRLPFKGRMPFVLGGLLALLILLGLGYVFLLKASVMVYLEPKVLERDMQVIADPTVSQIDEEGRKIPGVIVDTQVTGTEKGEATGKKKIGDPAKGVVIIFNQTNEPKTFSKGTFLSSSAGNKFILDSSVTIASQSASVDNTTLAKTVTPGRSKVEVTAQEIGPEGNLPTSSDLTVNGFNSSQFAAKAEGNFSGGTSKEVTVVTDSDQKRLLATVASNLKKQAQEQLQSKISDPSFKEQGLKIVEEALSEKITKRTYSKNINDQASDFSLTLTIDYKGTAYKEDDLKAIIGKLISTNIPTDFELNLAESETHADVSKVEDNGKVIFLARFRAKLMPKIDKEAIRKQIKGKTVVRAIEIIKTYENVLDSEIKISPPLPGPLQRLPFIDNNIQIEIGLK